MPDRRAAENRIEGNARGNRAHPAGPADIGVAEPEPIRVRPKMAARGVDRSLGVIDEGTAGVGVLVEDRGGQQTVATAEDEEIADAVSGGVDDTEHPVDLLDGERDRFADVIQELPNKRGILPLRGWIRIGRGWR